MLGKCPEGEKESEGEGLRPGRVEEQCREKNRRKGRDGERGEVKDGWESSM